MNYEQDIMKDLANGNTKAMEIIIKEYHPYVTAIVRTILSEHKYDTDIQDVVNEVFFLLWKNRGNIDALRYDRLKYYLGAIARNAAIKEKRRLMNYTPLNDSMLDNVSNPYSKVELRTVILSAMKELDKKSQIILLKFYFQGKSIQKIAMEENLSQTAVKSQLKRSRARLRKILEAGGINCED